MSLECITEVKPNVGIRVEVRERGRLLGFIDDKFMQKGRDIFVEGTIESFVPGRGIPRRLIKEHFRVMSGLPVYPQRYIHRNVFKSENARLKLEHIYLELGYERCNDLPNSGLRMVFGNGYW